MALCECNYSGNTPQWLAENAILATELRSHGIDFNCGCPSKTVNGSHGSSVAQTARTHFTTAQPTDSPQSRW
ncbi:tRNA-dihydrouridine synthase [Actinomadura keratinilytica]